MPFLASVPTWVWLAASAIGAIGGGIMSAIGQAQQASAMASQYSQQASLARQAGRLEVQRQRRRAHLLMGEQEAAYGKAGVELGAGTPLTVMKETARQAELDAQIIKWNALARSNALSAQADMYSSQIPGIYAGTVLNTIGHVGTSLLEYYRQPVTTNSGTSWLSMSGAIF